MYNMFPFFMFIHIINKTKYYLGKKSNFKESFFPKIGGYFNMSAPNAFHFLLFAFLLKENGAKRIGNRIRNDGVREPGVELSRGLCRPEP